MKSLRLTLLFFAGVGGSLVAAAGCSSSSDVRPSGGNSTSTIGGPDATVDGPEAGADVGLLETSIETDAGALQMSDVQMTDAPDAEYPPCTNRTCGPNLVCEYAMSDGCSAQGICVPFKSCGGAGFQPTYCGCDGRGVAMSCDHPGYVMAPVQSFWAVDGGGNWSAACLPCDAGGPCFCADGGPVQPVPSCASIAHP